MKCKQGLGHLKHKSDKFMEVPKLPAFGQDCTWAGNVCGTPCAAVMGSSLGNG